VRISKETGALVGRTALRLRNSANAPDADARTTLEDFRSKQATDFVAGELRGAFLIEWPAPDESNP